MSISAIGNGGFNVNFAASIQSAGSLGGAQGAGGADSLGLGAQAAGLGAIAGLGSQGNSSVNTVNALATALLIGAIAGGDEEEKKKSDPLGGAAAALLAYSAIMGLNQSQSLSPASAGLTAQAVASVGFSATA